MIFFYFFFYFFKFFCVRSCCHFSCVVLDKVENGLAFVPCWPGRLGLSAYTYYSLYACFFSYCPFIRLRVYPMFL